MVPLICCGCYCGIIIHAFIILIFLILGVTEHGSRVITRDTAVKHAQKTLQLVRSFGLVAQGMTKTK